jgi:hypothetical protein
VFEKQGVLILGKETGGDGWWVYYIPFTKFGRFLDLKGTPVLLLQSADWINEHCHTEPEALMHLWKQIADGSRSDFYTFEVAPKQ